ncbi:MAG TPA: MBL fold metallo-hydrolase [Anaerolineae bacterium]|nr:MBL fold metallo-hydrolase [Anaerolineae bacterium]HQH39396.1 MBL fold metallo-hydrolase [Anaerolineae bacterium]
MELTWYGLGCFRITERGYPAVVMDPFNEEETGLVLPRSRAEIVTSSLLLDDPKEAHWKGLRGVSRTLAGPGEYEIGGLFIAGVATFRDRKHGAERGQNVVFAVNVNGVVVCHLGELGHTPTQAQVEALGSVHVLLIPVGLPGGLNPAMASEIVSLIEPDIVVPMNYHTPGLRLSRNPVDRFLKEMGVTWGDAQPSLKVLPDASGAEETQVVLLQPQQG